MINNNAWVAINELVSRAAGVADAAIVDDKSLIDFGRKLSDTNADTFKNNLQPYLTGDNNVVEIDITGSGDAYVEDIDLNKNKLIIKGKSVYGQTVKEIDLPCAIDGELESCRYEEGAKKIRTSWSKVKGDGDEPWGGIVWSQDYTVVTDSRGNIISISR